MPRPKKKKLIDYSRIGRLVKPDPSNHTYALTWREGTWWLVYYNLKGISSTMSLRTEDPEKAKAIRDDVYRKAKTAGTTALSKMEFYAHSILKDPETNHGLKFMVFFGNRKGVFDSLAQAQAFRASIAKEIIETARKAPDSPMLRQRRKLARKVTTVYATSEDFRTKNRSKEYSEAV